MCDGAHDRLAAFVSALKRTWSVMCTFTIGCVPLLDAHDVVRKHDISRHFSY